MAYGAAILLGFAVYFSLAPQGLGLKATAAALSGWLTLSTVFRVEVQGEGEGKGRAGAEKRRERGSGWEGQGQGLDWKLLGMACDMSVKAVFKFLLEKGETLVLLRLFAPDTWAMYGIIQNLGSLVVRLIFLPVCTPKPPFPPRLLLAPCLPALMPAHPPHRS
jgi:hypothetical protein